MKKILLIAVLAISLGSCYNDKYDKLYPAPVVTVDPCDTATNASTYSGNVSGIISLNCATAGCHDANEMAGGYNLSTYAGVKEIADNGRLLITTNSGSMPKSLPKLSDCKIKQLTYWVNHGAQNN